MNLDGRSALVTGATGGLGKAIATTLRGRGVELTLTGRRRDVLEQLGARLDARTIVCDLADPQAVEKLAAETEDVDILIANAALPASGAIRELTVENIDRALAVNLRSQIVLAKHLGEKMAARRRGHIVFISSIAGKLATPGSALYSATKFGLRGFAMGLREDLFPHDVGVSSITPGIIRDAGMYHDSGAQLPPYVGTRPPAAVTAAVIKAIEENRCELDVAPLAVRAGAIVAGVAPELVAKVQRRFGADGHAAVIAEGQANKRS